MPQSSSDSGPWAFDSRGPPSEHAAGTANGHRPVHLLKRYTKEELVKLASPRPFSEGGMPQYSVVSEKIVVPRCMNGKGGKGSRRAEPGGHGYSWRTGQADRELRERRRDIARERELLRSQRAKEERVRLFADSQEWAYRKTGAAEPTYSSWDKLQDWVEAGLLDPADNEVCHPATDPYLWWPLAQVWDCYTRGEPLLDAGCTPESTPPVAPAEHTEAQRPPEMSVDADDGDDAWASRPLPRQQQQEAPPPEQQQQQQPQQQQPQQLPQQGLPMAVAAPPSDLARVEMEQQQLLNAVRRGEIPAEQMQAVTQRVEKLAQLHQQLNVEQIARHLALCKEKRLQAQSPADVVALDLKMQQLTSALAAASAPRGQQSAQVQLMQQQQRQQQQRQQQQPVAQLHPFASPQPQPQVVQQPAMQADSDAVRAIERAHRISLSPAQRQLVAGLLLQGCPPQQALQLTLQQSQVPEAKSAPAAAGVQAALPFVEPFQQFGASPFVQMPRTEQRRETPVQTASPQRGVFTQQEIEARVFAEAKASPQRTAQMPMPNGGGDSVKQAAAVGALTVLADLSGDEREYEQLYHQAQQPGGSPVRPREQPPSQPASAASQQSSPPAQRTSARAAPAAEPAPPPSAARPTRQLDPTPAEASRGVMPKAPAPTPAKAQKQSWAAMVRTTPPDAPLRTGSKGAPPAPPASIDSAKSQPPAATKQKSAPPPPAAAGETAAEKAAKAKQQPQKQKEQQQAKEPEDPVAALHDTLSQWTREKLAKLRGRRRIDVDGLVEFLMSLPLDDEVEVRGYIHETLGGGRDDVQSFVVELIGKRKETQVRIDQVSGRGKGRKGSGGGGQKSGGGGGGGGGGKRKQKGKS